MLKSGQFIIPINLLKKEKENNTDYLIQKFLEESTKICIIERNNIRTKKKAN